MPVGNIERLITNMRLMHAAGVRGFYIDHGTFHHRRSGWSELQAYLIYKLAQDIDADTDAIIEEFTDYMYGPAAPGIRQHIAELEAERKAITDLTEHGHVYATPGPGVSYVSRQLEDRVFPYLTPKNIYRWQQMWDGLEEKANDGNDRHRRNLALARRELDIATLWKWVELQADYPEYFSNHLTIVERIDAANEPTLLPRAEWEQASVNRRSQPISGFQPLIDIIETAGPLAPLPQHLDKVDPSTVIQIPAESAFLSPRWSGRASLVREPSAAGGLAVTNPVTKQPFSVGYFDELTRQRTQAQIDPDSVKDSGYALYRLGTAELSREAYFWLDSSWRTTFSEARNLFDPDNPKQKMELWVSLRFTGPSYPDKGNDGDTDHFYVDRIIGIPVGDTPVSDGQPKTSPADTHPPEFDFAQPNL